MEYKKGDKVRILYVEEYLLSIYGDIAIVNSYHPNTSELVYLKNLRDGKSWYYDTNKICLESVFQSPLFKALQEEE